MSLHSGVCWLLWLMNGWVPVDAFITGWRHEGHFTSKSLHQLPLMECTFSPLRFSSFTAVPSSDVWEGHGGMVLRKMYGESRRKPANSGSPGRMAVKLACVCYATYPSLVLPTFAALSYTCTLFIQVWLPAYFVVMHAVPTTVCPQFLFSGLKFQISKTICSFCFLSKALLSLQCFCTGRRLYISTM